MSSSSVEAVNPGTHATPSVWSAIREALSGAHGRDFTEGPIGRAIFILAVPMVLEMCMESVFAIVDVFVVAHLGADAVATVGITESFMTLIYALSMGLSIGAGAMISRRIGEKDPEGAAIAGVQAIVVGLLISLAMGIPAGIFAPQLLHLMGASPARIKRIAFGLSTATAAMAGAFLIILQPVEPSMGRDYIGRIFAICDLGGIGSLPGTFLAAVIVGVAESITATFYGPSWSPAIAFGFLLIALVVRPAGLFGRA